MQSPSKILKYSVPIVVGAAGVAAMEYFGISRFWQDYWSQISPSRGQGTRILQDAVIGFAIPAGLTLGLENLVIKTLKNTKD